MSAPDTNGRLAAAASDTAAEAYVSASALPTSPTAATAEAPTTGTSLFDPLHNARESLRNQSQASAQLHPLNSSLQSLYSASSRDGRLSRDEYRQLIAQIRHSVSQFAATTPALKPGQASSTQQADDANTANQLRRYISLLTETSTHTAALAHSIAPIRLADRDRKSVASTQPQTSASFPPQLQAGVFHVGSSQEPTSSWDSAIATLGALCETLENTAKALGLETFSEPSAEAATAPSDSASSNVLTHSLTLGAKILVIDIELHVVKSGTNLQPGAKLKLSYATDSADSHQTRDPRLGAVLERDVQLIAEKLFGPATSSDLQQDRALVAQALANWTSSLNELLILDDLEARASQDGSDASRTTDLFATMQELSAAVVRVADAEASSAASEATLLDRGHGLHKLHQTTPFLHSVFARDPTSKQDYTLSIGVQALDLPVADRGTNELAASTFPLSRAAEELLKSSAATPSLGSVPSPLREDKRVPLHVVLRLSPPVVVTRPTAAKLASICNLKHITPHNNSTGTTPAAPSGATWFEDVLASSWALRPKSDEARRPTRCTFTLAQSVESVRSIESQGLVIDSLPLLSGSADKGDAMDESEASHAGASTLEKLFAAIEVLRDEVKVTELMHSAVASTENSEATPRAEQGEKDGLSLDDLLASTSADSSSSKIAVTLAFKTAVQGATDATQQNLNLQLAFSVPADTGASVRFDASISPCKSASDSGWLLSATAKSEPSGKEARLDSSSPDALSIATKLIDLESLEDVVIDLATWAETQLDVHLNKPVEQAAFDPLTYEQQNVHAIYETIAPHFSSTRYKPWPLIPAFLGTVPPGSLGADLGCGNGKYLPIRSTLAVTPDTAADGEAKRRDSLLTIGVDRSSNLIGLARDNFGMIDGSTSKTDGRRQEVAVGDAIHSSLRTGLFDYAISIATIHHFSTWERRRASVQELIRVVAPVEPGERPNDEAATDVRLQGSTGSGRFMIFVWALEQKDEGKRQFQASDPATLKVRPEIDDPNHTKAKDRLVSYSGLQAAAGEKTVTHDQDVLVPWVLSTAKSKSGGRVKKAKSSGTVEAGLAALSVNPAEDAERPVYNRYYHMFRSGELEVLVEDAAASMPVVHRRGGSVAGVDVVREAGGWERGNWWGVWRVQWRQ